MRGLLAWTAHGPGGDVVVTAWHLFFILHLSLMSWITLSSADLAAVTAELATVKSIMLPGGVTADEVIAQELESTAALVRGFKPSSISLGPDGTIPLELKDAALAITRVKVFTRVKALNQFLTDARLTEKKDALELLKLWQAGKFAVVASAESATDQPQTASGAQLITRTTRRFTRTTLYGL